MHDMHGHFRPLTISDLRKCVTATYWGSSGRRFNPVSPTCEPDQT